MLVGNLVHKAPESIVLGILLRSAMDKIFSAAALAAVASVFLVIGAAAQIYGPRCRVHRFSWVLWRLQDPDFFSLAFICSGTSAHEMEPEPAAWSLAIGFAAVVLLEHATALVTRG